MSTGIEPTYKKTSLFPMIKLYASATVDPASLTTGTNTTGTITATGAVVGDYVLLSAGVDLQGQVLTAYVSAADTVTWVLDNITAGTINLASSTWHVLIIDLNSGAGVGI